MEKLTTNLARFAPWIYLAGLVLFALAIRLYRLEDLMIFTYDQGRDMYVLQTIARGDIKLVGPTTGLQGVFLGPFFYYILMPGYWLSNGSPFGVVKWLMLLITLTLPLAYSLLKPLVGRNWALVALTLLALAPGSIEEARVMWNPSFTAATLLVATWCLFRSQRQPWWLVGTALAFGCALQTELAYVVFLIPLFAIWVIARLPWPTWPTPANRARLTYPWIVVLASVMMFGATLVPQLVFEVKYEWLITRSLLAEMRDTSKQVSYASVWSARPGQMATEIVRGVMGTTTNYQWLFLPLLLLIMGQAWQSKQSPEARFLWWWFALPLLGFMLHRGNYGAFFGYYLSPHYAVTILVLILAFRQWQHYLNWRWLPAVVVIVAGAIFCRYALFIFDVSQFQYTAKTQMTALLAARQVADPQQTALEVFVPNLVPVAYQYLSEWMSRTGQTEPMDFGRGDHNQYVLLYEPFISDGSKVAFEKWYPAQTEGATCQPKQQFGITTLEYCQR